MNYKTFFKGKRVAVVGLGAHGEMIADIKFLLKSGADVSFFDLRSETRMQGPSALLKETGLTKYSFGKTPGEELLSAELILISPELSKKSNFLKKAVQAGIQIEYPEILFLKIVPPITLIGIMGETGKSTTAHMLYTILKQSFSAYDNQGLYFIDPDLPNGALTHLKKIKGGDVVLARITDDLVGEYYSGRISPYVAVLASQPRSPAKAFGLLEFQTHNNFIVAPDLVIDSIKSKVSFTPKAKMLRTRDETSAIVLQTAELFKVPQDISMKVIESFSGLKGHQELVKKIGGVEFFNDAASSTPSATLYALRKLSLGKNVVLILGGAYTGCDYSELIKNIPEHVSIVVLLPGSGSLGVRAELEALADVKFFQVANLEEAVRVAKENAKKGERVVFSPGCEAIGVHASRKERGEKFVKAVRGL